MACVMSKPTTIAIDHDDYQAKHVCRLPDGRQFFLTTPFTFGVPGISGRNFIALFLFDKRGLFLEARIDEVNAEDDPKHQATFDQRLLELGSVEYGRIEVQPFQVQRFGETFGLVPRPPEDGGDDWWVELLPGNYMAFSEPWDSGRYDT